MDVMCECGHSKFLEHQTNEGCCYGSGDNRCRCLHWYDANGNLIREAGKVIHYAFQRSLESLKKAFERRSI